MWTNQGCIKIVAERMICRRLFDTNVYVTNQGCIETVAERTISGRLFDTNA